MLVSHDQPPHAIISFFRYHQQLTTSIDDDDDDDIVVLGYTRGRQGAGHEFSAKMKINITPV